MELAFLMLLKKYYHILTRLESEGLLEEPLKPFEELTYRYHINNSSKWIVILQTGQLELQVDSDLDRNPCYTVLNEDGSTMSLLITLKTLVLPKKSEKLIMALSKDIRQFTDAGKVAVTKRYKVHSAGLYPYNERTVKTTSVGFE